MLKQSLKIIKLCSKIRFLKYMLQKFKNVNEKLLLKNLARNLLYFYVK